MWWEIHTSQRFLSVELSQLKQLALLVSGSMMYGFFISHPLSPSLCIGNSDFERMAPIYTSVYRETNIAIQLFTVNDELTLEYDDRVMLRFTPTHVNLIPFLASNYEYIRHTTAVSIIDRDSKSWHCELLLHPFFFLQSWRSIFLTVIRSLMKAPEH